MMFAIIKVGSLQYQVKSGDVIEVAKILGGEGDTVKLANVLLVNDGKTTSVGSPLVKGAYVEARIEAQAKDKKIEVRRYKSKVRYRKHIGFRAHITRLVIGTIHA